MPNRQETLSIILPAKDERNGLASLLPSLRTQFPSSEIIVIDDGSTDDTDSICRLHDVKIIRHPYSMGNGAAIKSGARHATGEILVFMDADGQHNPRDIPKLLEKLYSGYDMVVGARSIKTHSSLLRRLGNKFYNRLATIMTGHQIKDLTSGFRAVKAKHFRKFIYLLPNGFSYPTTITMAFFRSGFSVAYIPIEAERREGKSHIKMLKDGLRFFVIILKVGALFSPMRLFLPISGSLFLAGTTYYSYTYSTTGRFTNMSALLLISATFTFLIGILSEQISSLHYKGVEDASNLTKNSSDHTG